MSVEIERGDTVIRVTHGWEPWMDSFGRYDLIVRKSPEEMRAEKAAAARMRENTGRSARVRNTRKEPRDLVTVTKEGDHIFLPGLYDRFVDMLESRNIEYEVKDVRDMNIRPLPCYENLSDVSLRYGQDVALALIAKRDCGIIKCATAFGKTFLITQVCKMYPSLNIVIVCPSAQVIASIYSKLSKEPQLQGQVGYWYQRGNTSGGKRIVCTTTKSLPNLDPGKVQLMLFDEVHGCGDNQTGNDVALFLYCRRFGFSASPVRNDNSDLMLEALFGPVMLEISYQEAVEHGMVTPMRYLMLECDSCPDFVFGVRDAVTGNYTRPPIPNDDKIRLTRWIYRRNWKRNSIIVDVVERIRKVCDRQILIMTDTLEHAIILHQKLPDFKVVHYGAADLDEMQKKFKGWNVKQYALTQKKVDMLRHLYEKGDLKYVIATTTWKQGVDFVHLPVLIRAEGRTSLVDGTQIPGRLSRLDEGKTFGYLIDFNDTCHPWSKARSAAREKQYQEFGWECTTIEEMLNDLQRTTVSGRDNGVGGDAEQLSCSESGVQTE